MIPVCLLAFLAFFAQLSCDVIGVEIDPAGSDPTGPGRDEDASGASTPFDGVALREKLYEQLEEESKETEEGNKGFETLGFKVNVPEVYIDPGFKVRGSKKPKCLQIKEAGGMPQARHSPLKLFGYLHFDMNSRKYSLKTGLPLSKINGFPVPIKVGSRDYTLQGDLKTILLFLNCFSDYYIKGSFLGEDGHWHSTQQSDFPVFMQVQNVGPQAFGSVSSMVVQQSAERLLKAIGSRVTFIRAASEAIKMTSLPSAVKRAIIFAAANYDQFKNMYQLSRLAHVSLNDVQDAWEEISHAESFQEKAELFVRLLIKGRKHMESEKWIGAHRIDLSKPINVTVTMYPKRDNEIRATLSLSSNVVKVHEAFVALAGLSKRTRHSR